MIILLHGLDRYHIFKKWTEIKEKYSNKNNGEKPLIFDANNKEYEEFSDLLKQKSFFNKKRLIAVQSLFKNKKTLQKFCDDIEKFKKSDDIIVIFLFRQKNKTNDKTKKLLKAQRKCLKIIKKHSQNEEFNLLSTREIKTWVKKRATELELSFTSQALTLFIDYNNKNLWSLKEGLNKLNGFIEKGEVTTKIINELFTPSFETTAFQVVDAISDKNKKKYLELINQYLEQNKSPSRRFQLLGAIAFQLRSLITIKDYIQKGKDYSYISKKSSLHPYVVKKLYSRTQNFDMKTLKKIYHELFMIDLKIKVGEIEPDFGLNLLITKV